MGLQTTGPVSGSGDAGAQHTQLVALLPDITRAVTGLRAEREIFDAAMDIVGSSRTRAMVLIRPDGAPHMEAQSMSMGSILRQGVSGLEDDGGETFRFALSTAPTLRRALGGMAVQQLSMLELSHELFLPAHAERIAVLLGGKEGHAAVAPIRRGHTIIGALVAMAPPESSQTTATCAAIAGTLSAALTFARVLRRVDAVRQELPAENRARHALRSATELADVRIAGQRIFVPRPGGSPSLVPYRLQRTTAPPPPGIPSSGNARRYSGSAPRPDADDEARASILVVEDERRLRETTCALLSGLGYHVEAAASGEEAVATFSRAREGGRPFDLVLLDQTLGGTMGGTETLRMLHSIDASTRAILLSGLVDRTSREQLQKQGFLDCLAKPVSLEQLNAAIESALRSDLAIG